MNPDQGAPPAQPLHSLLMDASRGVLPPWANVGEGRLAHMKRVADLLAEWARARGVGDREMIRWVAAGYLHDALRDQDHENVRSVVGAEFDGLPGKVLHGPGAAQRLREDGVKDEELLHAVAFHTLGSPEFRELGMALYAADFLEPGRSFRETWRRALRMRAPEDLEGVVTEVVSARIRHLVEKGRPLHPRTVGFWNSLAKGQPWAGASEI